MTSTPVKAALIGALLASSAAPAFAQYQPTEQYQRDLERYEQQRAEYDRARDRYDDRRDSYEDARADYERRRDDYERARADYDRRYGYGSYARRYGPAPAWDANRWGSSDPYRPGYDRPGYDRPGYGYNDPCRDRRQGNTVAGGLIGALAGAALGSNVAANGARTEGAVLGALVGGGIGAAIGNSSAKCDDDGYYWAYSDTIPYREGNAYRGRRSGRYDYSYYNRQRCRLAAAPSDWGGRTEYRYVRVCPDRSGRYRITS